MKTLFFFLTVLALSAAATVANIKIRYDAKTSFAIFGTRVIYVFYSISAHSERQIVMYCVVIFLTIAYLEHNTIKARNQFTVPRRQFST